MGTRLQRLLKPGRERKATKWTHQTTKGFYREARAADGSMRTMCTVNDQISEPNGAALTASRREPIATDRHEVHWRRTTRGRRVISLRWAENGMRLVASERGTGRDNQPQQIRTIRTIKHDERAEEAIAGRLQADCRRSCTLAATK